LAAKRARFRCETGPLNYRGKKADRVDPHAALDDLKMEVRPRCCGRYCHQRDLFASFHYLAGLDQDLAQVGVAGLVAVAVVDDDLEAITPRVLAGQCT